MPFQQPRAIAAVAELVQAAVRHRFIKIGEVHFRIPTMKKIYEDRLHDIDGIITIAQQALGLAHQRWAKRAIRALCIMNRFHLARLQEHMRRAVRYLPTDNLQLCRRFGRLGTAA